MSAYLQSGNNLSDVGNAATALSNLGAGSIATHLSTDYVPTGSQVISVTDYPYLATGNGSTDDSAAIQSAVNACPVGGAVYFPAPSNAYGIGSTIVLPAGGNITLIGPNGRYSDFSGTTKGTITALAGSNLDALIAEYYWWNNNTSVISQGIQISNRVLNCNATNQTGGLGHGYAGKNWRSVMHHSAVVNCKYSSGSFPTFISSATRGFTVSAVSGNGTTVTFTCANNFTASQGIYLQNLAGGFSGLNGNVTVASASGTQFTVTNATTGATTTGQASPIDSTNNLIENYIDTNTFVGCTHGPWFNGSKCTDNWVTSNVMALTGGTGTGVRCANNSGSGFFIVGNHIYGHANGIQAGNISLATIALNYIEPQSGSIPASQGTLYGIRLAPNGTGLTVTGNRVRVATTNPGGNTYLGISAQWVGSGAVSITGNTVDGGTSASDTLVALSRSGGTTCSVTVAGNNYTPSNSAVEFSNSSTTVTVNGGATYATNLTTTNTEGFDRLPASAGAPTGVPADLTTGVPFQIDTTNGRLWAYYGGAWHYAAMT